MPHYEAPFGLTERGFLRLGHSLRGCRFAVLRTGGVSALRPFDNPRYSPATGMDVKKPPILCARTLCFWHNIHMRFIDRIEEMERLARLVREREGGFAAIWGRRRIGKSELLKEWCRRFSGIYTVADQSLPSVQRD